MPPRFRHPPPPPTDAINVTLHFLLRNSGLPGKNLLLLFSCSVMSDSSWPRGLQHVRPPCSSSSSRVCSVSCHPTISSSVIPFYSCLQSFPASGSFPMSWLFTSGGKSIVASAISPSSEYSGLISFRIDWFDLFAVQRTLKNLLQHHSSKAAILRSSALFMVQLSCLHMTTGKTIALTSWTFVGKVMSLLFNTLPRFVIAFLPRSKCLLISWLQSLSTVIWSPRK